MIRPNFIFMKRAYSFNLDIKLEPLIKKELQKKGFDFFSASYAFWRGKNKDGLSITFYQKGKLLIQGKDIEKMVDFFIQNKFITSEASNKVLERSEQVLIKTNKTFDSFNWIGVDESGKGDYFGPLVIAGVLMKKEIENYFLKIGVKDSKRLSDSVVGKIAEEIKAKTIHSIVSIQPLKYNQLYERIGNLNKLLAWGHSRVIENILEQEEVGYVIIDQFGKQEYLLKALMKKGKKVELKQQHHAEQDIAVASASILARATFNKHFEVLSQKYKIKLLKGASQQVIQTARDFVKKYGKSELKQVAKLHFKTTLNVLNKKLF